MTFVDLGNSVNGSRSKVSCVNYDSAVLRAENVSNAERMQFRWRRGKMRAVGTHKSGRKDVIISTVEASPFLRRALKNEEATNGTVSAAVSLIGAPLVKRLGFTTTIGASRKTCQSVHNTCKHNSMPAAGMSSLNGSEDIRSGHSEHIRRVRGTGQNNRRIYFLSNH